MTMWKDLLFSFLAATLTAVTTWGAKAIIPMARKWLLERLETSARYRLESTIRSAVRSAIPAGFVGIAGWLRSEPAADFIGIRIEDKPMRGPQRRARVQSDDVHISSSRSQLCFNASSCLM